MERVLIDTNIYAADEMGYSDAVEYIEQLIDDEAVIIMTTMVQMEIMSHFEIETDPHIKENREGYIKMVDEIFHVSKEEMELAADLSGYKKLLTVIQAKYIIKLLS